MYDGATGKVGRARPLHDHPTSVDRP